MRRYRGAIADSIRWQDFPLRDDDVIITTPSKCGTTWMQTIVGMLLLGRVDLGRPMGLLSPWLDIRTRSSEELFGLLDAQQHRRFIKTHTPLDGLPSSDSATYLAVIRHPLDAALSNRDHNLNWSDERENELRSSASPDDVVGDGDGEDGEAEALPPLVRPEDPAEYLRWWIDSDSPPGRPRRRRHPHLDHPRPRRPRRGPRAPHLSRALCSSGRWVEGAFA